MSLTAVRKSLDLVRVRVQLALDADRVPWTALATLTRQEVTLMREEAALVSEDENAAPTAEDIRAGILALPDELLEVARKALTERRKGGRR